MNLTYTPETCVGSSETATLLLLAWARDPQPSSLPSPGPTAHVRNDNRAQLRKTDAAEFPRNFLGGHCNFAEYFFEGPCALLSRGSRTLWRKQNPVDFPPVRLTITEALYLAQLIIPTLAFIVTITVFIFLLYTVPYYILYHLDCQLPPFIPYFL